MSSNLENLMSQERAINQVRFAISSEWPGSGLTTLVNLLSERLDLKAFSASRIQRAIVANYIAWTEKRGYQDSQVTWDYFEERYYKSENKVELITPYLGSNLATEDAMVRFKQVQRKYSKHLDFWTRIPDILTHEALATHHIIEGKLAIIIDQIIGDFPSGVDLVFRILLSVEPETSAKRVLDRKISQGEVPQPESEQEWARLLDETIEGNKKRMELDWASYPVTYPLNLRTGEPLSKNDLHKPKQGTLVIDTSYLTPEEVFEAVISNIIHRVTFFMDHFPEHIDFFLQLLDEISYIADNEWKNPAWDEDIKEYWENPNPK